DVALEAAGHLPGAPRGADRRHDGRHLDGGHDDDAERDEAEIHVAHQNRLTLMLRYFFGSALMAAMSERASSSVPLNFSYIALSFSSSPTVPSFCCNDAATLSKRSLIELRRS